VLGNPTHNFILRGYVGVPFSCERTGNFAHQLIGSEVAQGSTDLFQSTIVRIHH
jgi:hypothetical protein